MLFIRLVLYSVSWLVSLFVLRQDTGISIYALRSKDVFLFLVIIHKVLRDVLNNCHPLKTEFYRVILFTLSLMC